MTSDHASLTRRTPSVIIQRCWRGHCCRRDVQWCKEQLLWSAAVTIQDAWWRSKDFTWRLEHKNHVTYKPLWDAAWTIQQAWWACRGCTWRLPSTSRALYQTHHNAAYTIQDAWWQRRYSAQEWAEWDAARTIQRWFLFSRQMEADALAKWDEYLEHLESDEDEGPLYGELHYDRYVGGRRHPEDDVIPCRHD